MATRGLRFHVAAASTTTRATNNVRSAQEYLKRFGYLDAGRRADGFLRGSTVDALKKFQTTFRLTPTGQLDRHTARLMNTPRCGVADYFRFKAGISNPPHRYLTIGCSHPLDLRLFSYGITNYTTDVSEAAQRAAVARAFQTWQDEIPKTFYEARPHYYPWFKAGWYSENHGDGTPFDGVGTVLAHAFFPHPCGGQFAGHMHFDDAETWSTTAGSRRDIETVALHEIGHLLGLGHSDVENAVMYPYLTGTRRALHADDIEGIRSLYGRRGPALRLLAHFHAKGDMTVQDNDVIYLGPDSFIQGFQIDIAPAVEGLGLRYMAHIQDAGDVDYVTDGQYVGTRGIGVRMDGFAIETTGPAAADYTVLYLADVEGMGRTRMYRDGEYCGTKGDGRRLHSMLVRIEPRD